MAINYSVTQKSNPKDAMAEKKWYANAQVVANYTFEDLCKDVEKMSTLTEGDVQAVLTNSLHCIEMALKRSESVQFGDLGTFAVGLSSTGSETAEEFSAANIYKARVVFRQGSRFRSAVKDFQYKRVEARPHL